MTNYTVNSTCNSTPMATEKKRAAQVYVPKSVYYRIKLAADANKKPKNAFKITHWPTFNWDIDPNTSQEIDKLLYETD